MKLTILSGLLLVIIACATGEPNPTKINPVLGCHITCPGGYLNKAQHVCRGGRRWFADISIIGRYTSRSVDGSIKTDLWITRLGDVPTDEVSLGTCSSSISGIINGRDPSLRGIYPGEDEQGRPKP